MYRLPILRLDTDSLLGVIHALDSAARKGRRGSGGKRQNRKPEAECYSDKAFHYDVPPYCAR